METLIQLMKTLLQIILSVVGASLLVAGVIATIALGAIASAIALPIFLVLVISYGIYVSFRD